MLSPATWWNDAFINIPIAYVFASLVAWLWPKAFLAAFVIFYWGTNVLGSWLLLKGGRELIGTALKPQRPWLPATLTITYCVVMSVLILKGMVRPLPVPHREP